MNPPLQEFDNKKKYVTTEYYNMEIKGNASDYRNCMAVLRVQMTSTLFLFFFSGVQAEDLAVITSSSYYLYFTSNPSTNSDSPTIEIHHHLCGLHSFPRSEFILVGLLQPWLVFLTLPSVSSAFCQHSNQSNTVKMFIRSSVLHLELPQRLLRYSEKSTSLEWLEWLNRISHSPLPIYAPITNSHLIFCYSSLCSLYSGQTIIHEYSHTCSWNSKGQVLFREYHTCCSLCLEHLTPLRFLPAFLTFFRSWFHALFSA